MAAPAGISLHHRPSFLARKSPKRLAFSKLDRLIFASLYRIAPRLRALVTEPNRPENYLFLRTEGEPQRVAKRWDVINQGRLSVVQLTLMATYSRLQLLCKDHPY
jgi:hypothetical protein